MCNLGLNIASKPNEDQRPHPVSPNIQSFPGSRAPISNADADSPRDRRSEPGLHRHQQPEAPAETGEEPDAVARAEHMHGPWARGAAVCIESRLRCQCRSRFEPRQSKTPRRAGCCELEYSPIRLMGYAFVHMHRRRGLGLVRVALNLTDGCAGGRCHCSRIRMGP